MNRRPMLCAILAAVLFGVSTPLAKILVEDIHPIALAGLLYLGAFAGLTAYTMLPKVGRIHGAPLQSEDFPWLLAATLAGGIGAPILLLYGLTMTSGFSASLLTNMEGIATACIAIMLFKEHAGKRLWIALAAVTAAGVLISWNPEQNSFNLLGPLLIAAAMLLWGLDNNFTRNISHRSPVRIVQIKGLAAGAFSISFAIILGFLPALDQRTAWALVLGAFSYGLSLILFIEALEGMGSSRTATFFSIGPFVGAGASIIILGERLEWIMLPTIVLMAIGIWLLTAEKHQHKHTHLAITHMHKHTHDSHHNHTHDSETGRHTHEHYHSDIEHSHLHWPDTHHRHEH